MTRYRVARQHFGDRLYSAGDMREAKASDVKHLVDNGVLVEEILAPASAHEEKATGAPQNKASVPPKNKTA